LRNGGFGEQERQTAQGRHSQIARVAPKLGFDAAAQWPPQLAPQQA
jgi:hypothetical protein